MTQYYGIKLPPLNKEPIKHSKTKSPLNRRTVYVKDKDENVSLSESSKNLKEKIDDLPDVLMREIFGYLLPISNTIDFFDYARYYVWYQEFTDAYHSSQSQRLDIVNIRPWIPRVLALPLFTKICIHGIPEFNMVWQKEKRQNRKNFVKMRRGNSFAQSLLMMRYH